MSFKIHLYQLCYPYFSHFDNKISHVGFYFPVSTFSWYTTKSAAGNWKCYWPWSYTGSWW